MASSINELQALQAWIRCVGATRQATSIAWCSYRADGDSPQSLTTKSTSPQSALRSSDPQTAALEVLQEVHALLSELPLGWRIAVLKALLIHHHNIVRTYGSPPQQSTSSA
jgi:hypothetical protein